MATNLLSLGAPLPDAPKPATVADLLRDAGPAGETGKAAETPHRWILSG